MDWSKYPNFTEDEFRCSHSGLVDMDEDFIHRLQGLRTDVSAPFVVFSGYRHKTHPIEAAKPTPGEHFEGKASDVGCWGSLAYKIIERAPHHGFTRIGVSQATETAHNKRFIHLGTSTRLPHPTIWSY